MKVRRLTEKEALKLQGFSAKDAETLADNFSKSACYRMAGNSVTVDVFELILMEILYQKNDSGYIL